MRPAFGTLVLVPLLFFKGIESSKDPRKGKGHIFEYPDLDKAGYDALEKQSGLSIRIGTRGEGQHSRSQRHPNRGAPTASGRPPRTSVDALSLQTQALALRPIRLGGPVYSQGDALQSGFASPGMHGFLPQLGYQGNPSQSDSEDTYEEVPRVGRIRQNILNEFVASNPNRGTEDYIHGGGFSHSDSSGSTVDAQYEVGPAGRHQLRDRFVRPLQQERSSATSAPVRGGRSGASGRRSRGRGRRGTQSAANVQQTTDDQHAQAAIASPDSFSGFQSPGSVYYNFQQQQQLNTDGAYNPFLYSSYHRGDDEESD